MASIEKKGSIDLALETFDGLETDRGGLRADPCNIAVMDAEIALVLIETNHKPLERYDLEANGSSLKMPIGFVAVGSHDATYWTRRDCHHTRYRPRENPSCISSQDHRQEKISRVRE
jgi:hypothetical protein